MLVADLLAHRPATTIGEGGVGVNLKGAAASGVTPWKHRSSDTNQYSL